MRSRRHGDRESTTWTQPGRPSRRPAGIRVELLAVIAVTGAVCLAPGIASAAATDNSTVTCMRTGTVVVAGVTVSLVNAGAAGGTHLPCGTWFSPYWFEHFHPNRASTVATAWTFSPNIQSAYIRINANADGGSEKYTIIAKDAGGSQVGPSIIYDNRDEPGKRFDFPAPVARVEAWHTAPGGALALLNFSIPSNKLQVNLSGDGSVASDVGNIDCGVDSADCAASFADLDPSTVVTLTATPDTGQVFSGWSGDCAGQTGTTCTVTMDQARDVTASFSGPSYGYLAVDVSGEGRIVSNPEGIDWGLGGATREGEYIIPAQVTLTAIPQTGWKFIRWEGDRCSGSSSACLVNVDDCLSTKAVFEKADVKVHSASTRSRQRRGARSVAFAFKSTGDGHATIRLSRCSGSTCSSRRLVNRLALVSGGANRLRVTTPALAPGRYRIEASTSGSSSHAFFTVPKPRTSFTG